MKRNGGFTLLELIIVIIIIGILAAIAIPRITTGTASAASSRAAHTIANYATFVNACLSGGVTPAATATNVANGTVPDEIKSYGINPPLRDTGGTASDGMWTYTYDDPVIKATKNENPQDDATILYNINNNQWVGADGKTPGDFSPQPTST